MIEFNGSKEDWETFKNAPEPTDDEIANDYKRIVEFSELRNQFRNAIGQFTFEDLKEFVDVLNEFIEKKNKERGL